MLGNEINCVYHRVHLSFSKDRTYRDFPGMLPLACSVGVSHNYTGAGTKDLRAWAGMAGSVLRGQEELVKLLDQERKVG